MNAHPTKILVVDDSALYRQSIQNVLREVEDVTIVGIAKNGVEALAKIESLDPDLLTLDVRMPDMDGIEVLQAMKKRRLRPKAIMVSSLTSEGAKETTDALMEGAFDFILKPSSNDSLANRQQLRDELATKITAFRESQGGPRRRRSTARSDSNLAPSDTQLSVDAACQVVVMGTSTGGPEVLKAVLPRLPKDLPVPVLVVQHMPPQYTSSLASRLDDISELEVVEATPGMPASAGQIFLAPGGRQLKLTRSGSRLLVDVRDDPAENGVRPSVDYTLRSALRVVGGEALAVIMTGMGRDGLISCQQLKEAGGYVFAQSQDDCVVYGMSKAVIEQGLADRVLPRGKMAPAIVRHLKRCRRS